MITYQINNLYLYIDSFYTYPLDPVFLATIIDSISI